MWMLNTFLLVSCIISGVWAATLDRGLRTNLSVIEDEGKRAHFEKRMEPFPRNSEFVGLMGRRGNEFEFPEESQHDSSKASPNEKSLLTWLFLRLLATRRASRMINLHETPY